MFMGLDGRIFWGDIIQPTMHGQPACAALYLDLFFKKIFLATFRGDV